MLLTLSQQQELVRKGLAVAKTNGKFITFKYHRKVMYDYLWKKYPELLECRGHTYDLTNGNLVLAAPTKSFNYLEDGHWKDVPLDTKVNIYKKFNGFMATLSVYEGEVVIGTTGTTNSDYAKMAREMIYRDFDEHNIRNNFGTTGTYLFEICHPNDPHIVEEKYGAAYLGYRSHVTDKHYTAGEYVPVAADSNYYHHITLGEALEIARKVKHEGFMVYDEKGNVCKMKSPYYVGKKKLMRSKDKFIEQLWNERGLDQLPEMWHSTVLLLIQDVWEADWRAMPEQDRRKVLESYE